MVENNLLHQFGGEFIKLEDKKENLEKLKKECKDNGNPNANPTQQKGLEYYEQVLQRIPRQEIEQFEILLNQQFKTTQNQLIKCKKRQ